VGGGLNNGYREPFFEDFSLRERCVHTGSLASTEIFGVTPDSPGSSLKSYRNCWFIQFI
jgi:hypothetical protein